MLSRLFEKQSFCFWRLFYYWWIGRLLALGSIFSHTPLAHMAYALAYFSYYSINYYPADYFSITRRLSRKSACEKKLVNYKVANVFIKPKRYGPHVMLYEHGNFMSLLPLTPLFLWCGITVNSFAVAHIIENGFSETIAATLLSTMAFYQCILTISRWGDWGMVRAKNY